jgi:hypothetical protein
MTLDRRALWALTLVGLVTGGVPAPVGAEEMMVEGSKTYTPATENGRSGYRVQFERRRYVRNRNDLNFTRVGEFDRTIQEAFETAGASRALTEAEMRAIYSKYGIPTGNSENYDYSLHDFNFNTTLQRIRQDLAAAGAANLPQASAADIQLMNKLANSSSSREYIDSLGVAAVNSDVLAAFAANVGGNMSTGYNGGRYVYTAEDGVHSLSYTHGVNEIYEPEFDQATYNAYRSSSIQSVLMNDPAALKRIIGMGNIDSVIQAGRLLRMAELIERGVNPLGLTVDTWVNTVNGRIHLEEVQPTSARLRELSRFLVASTWTTHSPIALDLNHDGKIGVTGSSTAQNRLRSNGFVAAGAVWFDLMAAGKKQRVEWLNGDGDGFLIDDTGNKVSKAAAGDGVIDAHALFGNARGYANGYHKMAVKIGSPRLAANFKATEGNSWSGLLRKSLSLKGKELASLKVWVDASRDGLVQPEELKTLNSLGITEIGTVPTTMKNAHGEYVIQSFFIQNGRRHMTEDVWFAEDPTTEAAAAPGPSRL